MVVVVAKLILMRFECLPISFPSMYVSVKNRVKRNEKGVGRTREVTRRNPRKSVEQNRTQKPNILLGYP